MEGYKLRIEKAMSGIEQAIEVLLTEKVHLVQEIEILKNENANLKNLTESAIKKLDKYIAEFEDIRRDHGSSNSRN